jgi:hypothetical protein
LIFLKDNGVVIISIVASLALFGLIIYLLINKRSGGSIERGDNAPRKD